MAKHTIELSAVAEARLGLLVAQYNVGTGASLSLDDWLALHLKELAAQRELQQAAEGINQQAQADANAAVNAERERLLGTM